MRPRSFVKMHGLGNDFAVFDARVEALALTPERIRAIADRREGVGCDQLIVMEPPRDSQADVFMRIYNADGTESGACGNATRCIARLIMDEKSVSQVIVETVAGLLDAEEAGRGLVAVDMGPARLDWREIPLAEARDTLHLGLAAGPLRDPVGVGMGNPHAVFFVDDVAAVDLEKLGPGLETDPLFPEYCNIEAAQVISPTTIRMRVWERGSGVTRACGTGACATLVAAARRGLTGRKADVILDGGALSIEWQPDGHVLMTGPVAFSFRGELDASPPA